MYVVEEALELETPVVLVRVLCTEDLRLSLKLRGTHRIAGVFYWIAIGTRKLQTEQRAGSLLVGTPSGWRARACQSPYL